MLNELKKKYNVLNWAIALVLLTLAITFCKKAGLGMSMISAPPYILYVALGGYLPWLSHGMCEYIFQAVLLLIMVIIVRRFKISYLLSFLTSVIAGFLIDGWTLLFGPDVYASMFLRVLCMIPGIVLCSIAVALFFRTTLPLQIYELIVTEITDRFGLSQHKVKQCFDIIMLVLSVTLALVLTGGLTGIGVSTVLAVLVNAALIAFFGKIIDKLEKS